MLYRPFHQRCHGAFTPAENRSGSGSGTKSRTSRSVETQNKDILEPQKKYLGLPQEPTVFINFLGISAGKLCFKSMFNVKQLLPTMKLVK